MREVCTKRELFGKEVEIVIDNINSFLAEDIFEETYKEGIRLQKIFNFFDNSSELSLLNTKRKLSVSSDLLKIIQDALKFCNLTNGAYDISLGKQFIQIKKGDKLNKSNCSFKDIEIKNNLIILKNKDVLIDLGSVAKGYIADKMAEFLISKGILSGLVDARGDIRVFGKNYEIIDIQHPRDKNKILFSIKIKNSGVATSGDYNQYIKNFDNCHILNKKNLISVTVVAPTLKDADIYATVLFVSKEKDIKRLLNKNKTIKVLTIDNNLDLKFYNGFEKLIVGV